METEMLTITEIAELSGLHPETVRRLAQAGKLPGATRTRLGWRLSRADLDGFIKSGGARPIGRPARTEGADNG